MSELDSERVGTNQVSFRRIFVTGYAKYHYHLVKSTRYKFDRKPWM